MQFLIFLISLLMVSVKSFSLETTNWQNSENFLSHKSLGAACSSIRNQRIDPPCNPAHLDIDRMDVVTDEQEGLLAAQLMLGDTYSYFYKNRDLFNSDTKNNLIKDLLTQKDTIGLDSSLQFWWKQQGFVFGIEPLRLHSYSEVLNSAYPDIFMEGVYQQSVYFQYAHLIEISEISKSYWGVQVRLLDRQIIAEHVYLFDALTNLDNYFQIQRQKAVLIEPGFSWDLSTKDSDWNPMLSVKFSQLGFVDKKVESLPLKTFADIGVSFAPSTFWQNFEFGLNYRTNSEREASENLSFASSLAVSWVQIYLGVEKDLQSVGLSTRFRNWSSGIIFQKKKSILESSDRDITFLEFRILI